MNTPFNTPVKFLYPALLLLIISIAAATAQKLPNVQQTSILAPENIKIDGKADEWGDKFQAYNHATEIFYTIANDNQNLYLIVRTEKPDVIKKITSSGLIFTLYKSEKKDDGEAVSISYPVYDKGNRPFIQFKNKPVIVQGSPASIMQADSFINVMNKRLIDKTKYIQITGAKGLDTLTSVYNEVGIKAAQLFNNQMFYTYELAVPLKHLDINVNAPVKFAYHITISKIKSLDDMNPGVTRTVGPDGLMRVSVPSNAEIPASTDLPLLFSSTDFWGTYTLAKK